MKKIICSFALLFLTLASFAALSKAEVDLLWDKANVSYSEGKYAEALELYGNLEKEAGVSASLYYNIGNSYFKQNMLAKAILYYNRALRLDPANGDIEHNLSVANALTISKIKEMPTFFVVRWIEEFRNMMSSNGWAIFSIVCFALTLILVLLFLLSKKSYVRKYTFTFGLITLFFTLVAMMAGGSQRSEQLNTSQAIVMNNSAAVKSSPDNSGKDIFVLNEGVKAEIKERIGDWSRVVIASGDSGWINSSNLEII